MVKVKLEFIGGLDFHIDDFTAYGDYMVDLPYEWLESIRVSLQKDLPLCFQIDGGSSKALIVSDLDTFVIDDRDWIKHSRDDFEYYFRVFKIDRIDLIKAILPQLKANLDKLVRWDYRPDYWFTEQALKDRDSDLRALIKDCEELLEKNKNQTFRHLELIWEKDSNGESKN